MTRKSIVLIAASAVALAAAVAAFFIFRAPNVEIGVPALSAVTVPEQQETAAARSLGNPEAPVTIIEYSSLTCPHCADFHREVLPRLKQEYIEPGYVRLIYRDFPFDRFAVTAAVLARCAPPERYFTFLDVLFARQADWAGSDDPLAALEQLGNMGGVGSTAFKACMEDEKLLNAVLSNRLTGVQVHGVDATPTFIINNQDRIVGARDFSVFAEAIEKYLNR